MFSKRFPEWKVAEILQVLKINKVLYDRINLYTPLYQDENIYDVFENALNDIFYQVRVMGYEKNEIIFVIRDKRIRDFYQSIIKLARTKGNGAIKPTVCVLTEILDDLTNLNTYCYSCNLGKYKKNISAIESIHLKIYEEFDLFTELFDLLVKLLDFYEKETKKIQKILYQELALV